MRISDWSSDVCSSDLIMDLGFRSMELDLSDTHSLAEAQAKIAAYAEANPERTWILGGGWDQEKWGLGRFPTAAELDGVAGGRPIALTRIDRDRKSVVAGKGWSYSVDLGGRRII